MRRRKGNPVPGGINGPTFLSGRGGLKNWDNKIVFESRGTQTKGTALARPSSTINYRPVLSPESAPHIKNPQLLDRKQKFGHGLQTGARQQDRLPVVNSTSSERNYPVTGLGGLWGCEILRIQHCLDIRQTGGGKFVSPTHQPHFTP
jgi:hypothetical protein